MVTILMAIGGFFLLDITNLLMVISEYFIMDIGGY